MGRQITTTPDAAFTLDLYVYATDSGITFIFKENFGGNKACAIYFQLAHAKKLLKKFTDSRNASRQIRLTLAFDIR